MKETLFLLRDMLELQSYAMTLESDVKRTNLPDDVRLEFQARLLYLLRHLRVAATIIDVNLDSFLRRCESVVTPEAKESLKDMTLYRALGGHTFQFYSKTMERIHDRINEEKLKSVK